MTPPPDFPLEQYRALREGFGYVELTGWSSVTLTGADRQAFLNNFCTNNVKQLQPGEHCEAFLTNVKGKVRAHVLVNAREKELVLVAFPGQAESIVSHLDRYVIREDVQLRDTTAERSFVLISGGDGAGPGLTHDAWIRWHLLHAAVCGLVEATPAALPNVLNELKGEGATACSAAAFDALRIESGTPQFGVDFDDENLPQEVGRDELAISFIKGCYLGQETVARIDALGHVNQGIAGLRFDGGETPAPKLELMQGDKSAGHITSATYSPELGAPLALAMVRRQSQPPGTRLDSSVGTCEVVDLPLHKLRA